MRNSELKKLLVAELNENPSALIDLLFDAAVELQNLPPNDCYPERRQMFDDAVRDLEILRNASYEWGS